MVFIYMIIKESGLIITGKGGYMKITFENHKPITISKWGVLIKDIIKGKLYISIYMGDDIKLWLTIKTETSSKNVFLGEFATGAEVMEFLEGEEYQKIPFSDEISKVIKYYLAI